MSDIHTNVLKFWFNNPQLYEYSYLYKTQESREFSPGKIVFSYTFPDGKVLEDVKG
jgi:hypothetical protein